MQLIVDGLIYRHQSHGGISRIFNEILPRMGEIDPALEITLLTHGHLQQPLPAHRAIRHQPLFPVDSLLRPYRLWWPVLPMARAAVQRRSLGKTSEAIWHSTYYTRQEDWRGPVVVTLYDMIHERFPEMFGSAPEVSFRRRKRASLISADRIICISNATARDLRKEYDLPSDRIAVIPLACSPLFRVLDPASTPSLPTPRKPFLLYVGNRSHHKNFDTLLKAYGTWAASKDVDLVVVGKPWDRRESVALSGMSAAAGVRRMDPVDDEHLCELYNRASAFVYPSHYEGFGIPLLEAMSCGCPVVASRIDSTQEVSSDCPAYFHPEDPEGLQTALDAVLREGRRSDRVARGLSQARRFSWDATAKATLRVYSALAGR